MAALTAAASLAALGGAGSDLIAALLAGAALVLGVVFAVAALARRR